MPLRPETSSLSKGFPRFHIPFLSFVPCDFWLFCSCQASAERSKIWVGQAAIEEVRKFMENGSRVHKCEFQGTYFEGFRLPFLLHSQQDHALFSFLNVEKLYRNAKPLKRPSYRMKVRLQLSPRVGVGFNFQTLDIAYYQRDITMSRFFSGNCSWYSKLWLWDNFPFWVGPTMRFCNKLWHLSDTKAINLLNKRNVKIEVLKWLVPWKYELVTIFYKSEF